MSDMTENGRPEDEDKRSWPAKKFGRLSKKTIGFFEIWEQEQSLLGLIDPKQDETGSSTSFSEIAWPDSRLQDANSESAASGDINAQSRHSSTNGNTQKPGTLSDAYTIPPLIKETRKTDPDNRIKTLGLALSGGGIRAASFSLGVMQGMNVTKVEDSQPSLLQHVDYLSTVSGGGYAGSALTYYKHLARLDPDAFKKEYDSEIDLSAFPKPESEVLNRAESRMLDYTRFRKNHLMPTHGLNFNSLFSVALRTVLTAWPIYLSVLTVLMFGAYVLAEMSSGVSGALVQCPKRAGMGWICDQVLAITPAAEIAQIKFGISVAIIASGIFAFWTLVSIFASTQSERLEKYQYEIRRTRQIWLGLVIGVFTAGIIYALLPLLSQLLTSNVAIIAGFVLGGNAIAGVSLSALRKGALTKFLFTPRVALILSSVIILFGNLMLSYNIVNYLRSAPGTEPVVLSETKTSQEIVTRIETVSRSETKSADKMVTSSETITNSELVSRSDTKIDGNESQVQDVQANVAVTKFVIVSFIIVFSGAAFFANLNYLSFTRMYRDRLMEAFMPNYKAFKNKDNKMPATRADRLSLSQCNHRPLHLINTNVVLSTSQKSRYRGRSGDSFILAPHFCGSWATGYKPTSEFSCSHPDNGMGIATAMAISGAAFSPRVGPSGWDTILRHPIIDAMISFLNLRLGFWTANPSAPKQTKRATFWNAGLRGIINAWFDERRRLVELTDGGHFENTGIFELLRRRVDVIILADASADKEFNFKDIGIAIERARVDQSIDIRFHNSDYDLTHIMPGSAGSTHYDERYALARQGYALATITYPAFEYERPTSTPETTRSNADKTNIAEPEPQALETTGYEKEEGEANGADEDTRTETVGKKYGLLIYLKTAVTRNMPLDIYSYKGANPGFPNQSITDQNFDESQFEAYRELGFQTVQRFLKDHPHLISHELGRDDGVATPPRIRSTELKKWGKLFSHKGKTTKRARRKST